MNPNVRFGLRTSPPTWTTVYPAIVRIWRTNGDWKTGCDVTPESTMGEALSDSAYDFDLYLDLCYPIEQEFGLDVPRGAWINFLKCSRDWKLTSFRALSEFVARHVERIEIHPVDVLGKACLPAACFAALERCATGCAISNIWSSHDIWAEVGATKIERFWRKARWTFPALPPLRTTWLSTLSSFLTLIAFMAGLACFGSCLICDSIGAFAAISLLLATLLSAALATAIRDVNNRLPIGIRTFGEFSSYLADRHTCTAHRDQPGRARST